MHGRACGRARSAHVTQGVAVSDKSGSPSIDDQMAETWLDTLALSAAFDRGWVEAVVEWLLTEPPADVVVDAGCGAGGAAHAFAARLPAETRVLGIDRDPRLLSIAEHRSRDLGLDGRVDWVAGRVDALPLPDGAADLVWASGVVHHLADQQAGVAELARLCRPGGRLVLIEGGLPLRCLPFEIGIGRPGLEARLEEARTRWFVDMRAELPGVAMPYGWLEAIRRAGLADTRSRSFLAEAAPPLDDVGRAVVTRHLTSALNHVGDRLDPDDREVIARMLDSDDPAYVGDRHDLMATAVRTVHVGAIPPP
ncbi:MAG: methyltransferase domain-containing protein [Micromonosporaceae bacterium]|nr:methyltransferase domain-containing protein [Micromonosporaceae bacterium]